jgi:hypothetical protein
MLFNTFPYQAGLTLTFISPSGTAYVLRANEGRPAHVFPATGSYDVTVSSADAKGLFGNMTQTIAVYENIIVLPIGDWDGDVNMSDYCLMTPLYTRARCAS